MRVADATNFNDKIPLELRLAIANSIAGVVDSLIPGDPPLGIRPITLILGPGPRVLWSPPDYQGKTYRIHVSAANGFWQQLAFQLSHELTHIKLGPARSNLLLEVFAVLMSHRCLQILKDDWTDNPPSDWEGWPKYAAGNPKYISDQVTAEIGKLPAKIRDGFALASEDERLDRLKSVRPAVASLSLDHIESRAWQHAAADTLLSLGIVHWEELLGLGMKTDPSPKDEIAFSTSYPILDESIPDWVPAQLR